MQDERYKRLKEDLAVAHEIMCRMGDYVHADPDKSEEGRMFYYLARSVYDILEEILRKLGMW